MQKQYFYKTSLIYKIKISGSTYSFNTLTTNGIFELNNSYISYLNSATFFVLYNNVGFRDVRLYNVLDDTKIRFIYDSFSDDNIRISNTEYSDSYIKKLGMMNVNFYNLIMRLYHYISM